MIPGRPFRFLYLVLCLWFVSRAAAWMLGATETSSAAASGARRSGRFPEMASPGPRFVPGSPAAVVPFAAVTGKTSYPRFAPERHPLSAPRRAPGGHAAILPAARPSWPKGIFDAPPDGSLARFPAPPAAQAKADRWLLSAWLLYRPDNDAARLANAGQLGASQAGVRLAYDLAPSASYVLALHGRVSTALDNPMQAEGAVGVTLRPVRTFPVALAVERRFDIGDGGRNAFAAYVSGGLDAAPLPAGLEMEGYAQAGIVGASRTDLFADGRISISRPLAADWGAAQIAGGFAVSGGVQPSLSRLDIGPQLSVRFPLGHGHARVAVEWRERVAGNARPASGPAIMLASDF